MDAYILGQNWAAMRTKGFDAVKGRNLWGRLDSGSGSLISNEKLDCSSAEVESIMEGREGWTSFAAYMGRLRRTFAKVG